MTERPPGRIDRHVLPFWRALDDLFARVRPTPWGAVVTDPRYPAVADANYARVETDAGTLRASDVDRALEPALEDAGAGPVHHVVSFHPAATTDLLSDLSMRGHRLTWDVVMERTASLAGDLPAPGPHVVEELEPGEELWERMDASLALFGMEPGETRRQVGEIERSVLAGAGKRWFGVRDPSGLIVSLGALVVLEGVGYLDNVATFPGSRRHGLASSVTAHAAGLAHADGVRHVFLLADPGAAGTVLMYERLGFRYAGHLAATRGPRTGPAASSPADRVRGTAGTEPS